MNIKDTTLLTAGAVLLSLSASAKPPHGRGDVVDLNRPDPDRERPVVIVNQPAPNKPMPGTAPVPPGPRPVVVPPGPRPVVVPPGPKPVVVPPGPKPVVVSPGPKPVVVPPGPKPVVVPPHGPVPPGPKPVVVPPGPRPVVVPPGPRPVVVPPHAHHHGMFNVPLEGPRERSYYHSWGVLVGDGFYRFDALNENYRVELHKHRTISFRLEENASTGFTWFARVSDSKVGVSIDHQQVVPTYGGAPMVGVPGCAEISIKGRHHGDALVELIYARPLEWQRGAVPARVIRLYVDVN